MDKTVLSAKDLLELARVQEMARVRRTVAYHRAQALSAGENTATEVMHGCLAFGCNTVALRSGWSSFGLSLPS